MLLLPSVADAFNQILNLKFYTMNEKIDYLSVAKNHEELSKQIVKQAELFEAEGDKHVGTALRSIATHHEKLAIGLAESWVSASNARSSFSENHGCPVETEE